MCVFFLQKQSATDVVVLRGWYTKLTVCLYGYFTNIQEVPPTVPTAEPQQNPPVFEEKAGPVIEPQGLESFSYIVRYATGLNIRTGGPLQ